MPESWRDFLARLQQYLIALAVFGVIAAAWWSIPSWRLPFVPDVWSWATVTLAAATCTFFLFYLADTGWFGRAILAVADTSLGAAAAVWSRLPRPGRRLPALAIVFFAGAIVLDKAGLAPSLDRWITLDSEVVAFFVVYAAAVILLWLLAYGLLYPFRSPIPEDEIRRFKGRLLARLLIITPTITALAQAASFVTSYIGIRILLSQALADVQWIDLALPVPDYFAQIFGLDDDTLAVQASRIDIISIAASFLMSLIIWLFSAIAIARVRGGQRVPPVLMYMIVVLGTVSTYTAFVMWNGENAVAAELRAGIAATKALVSAFEEQDEIVLGTLADDVQAQAAAQQRQLDGLRRATLTAELDQLLELLAVPQRRFGAIEARGSVFQDSSATYLVKHECEIDRGCVSGVSGGGTVSRALLTTSDELRQGATAWERLVAARKMTGAAAEAAAQRAQQALERGEFDLAQELIVRLRRALREILAAEPTPVLQRLVRVLRATTASVGDLSADPTVQQAQLESLSELRAQLQADMDDIAITLALWQGAEATDAEPAPSAEDAAPAGEVDLAAATGLPRWTQLSEIGPEIQSELSKLGGLRQHLLSTIDERQGRFDGVGRKLLALESLVGARKDQESLIETGAVVTGEINDARRLLVPARNLETDSVVARIQELDQTRQYLAEQLEGRTPTYPPIEGFVLTPLHFSILFTFYLAMIPLLIQILLDFGYTIAVVLAVSKIQDSGAG